MKFLDGAKTYIGSVGLILLGAGGILAHETTITGGLTKIALGLIGIGLRSFGQKLLNALSASKPQS